MLVYSTGMAWESFSWNLQKIGFFFFIDIPSRDWDGAGVFLWELDRTGVKSSPVLPSIVYFLMFL